MTSIDIPADLFASQLTANNEPAQRKQIKPSKAVGKENESVATKQEFKKPATRKRKMPLQDAEESRPQKRAKIEKSEQILPPKLDPLLADLKANIKDILLASDLNLHLSPEKGLSIDPELLQSPDKLKTEVKAETPNKLSTPLKTELQNIKIEQQNSEDVHPFDIQQGIEISKITEESRLFLGNADVANNSAWMLSANVTHIVNVASEVPNYYEKIFFNDDEFQFTYRKEPFNDSEHENIMPKLHDLTDFIKRGLESGSVLVHCKMGQSRSVSIIYAYLIKHGGDSMTLQLAKRFIEEELKVLTKLNNGFKRQLMDFEKEIKNVTQPSHDFFVLPKRISTPPARLRTLDHFSQKSRSLNSSPATPQRRVNSASPRKTPTALKTNSARKAKANTNKLLRAAVGSPSVKDMLERASHTSSTQQASSEANTNNVNSSDNNNNNNNVNSSSKSDSDSAQSDGENVVPSLPEDVRISLKLSGVKYK